MSGKAFLDTNILIYAIETAGPDAEKSATARQLTRSPDVCISTQVLGEFYSAATSARRLSPLAHNEAVAWVQYWKRLEVQPITEPQIDLALEIVGRHRIKYYDALILATARLAGCRIVHSEDFSADQDYGGVRVLNPFQAGAG